MTTLTHVPEHDLTHDPKYTVYRGHTYFIKSAIESQNRNQSLKDAVAEFEAFLLSPRGVTSVKLADDAYTTIIRVIKFLMVSGGHSKRKFIRDMITNTFKEYSVLENPHIRRLYLTSFFKALDNDDVFNIIRTHPKAFLQEIFRTVDAYDHTTPYEFNMVIANATLIYNLNDRYYL